MLSIWCAALLLQFHAGGKHGDVFGEKEAAEKAVREIDAAGVRFKEIFGADPVRGALVLTRDGQPARDAKKDLAFVRFGAKWIWRWEPKSGAEPDETMTHEQGHLWLTFWADGMEPPKVKQYGSTLPDWLDEGFANLLEGPKAHRAYRDEVRRRGGAGTLAPLKDMLGWIHPDSRQKTDIEKAKDRWLFYAQSYGFAAFLVEKYGDKGFRNVAGVLKSGKPFSDSLGAHGLPATLAELETAWKAWAVEPAP